MTCSSADLRTLNSTSCPCNSSYYDNGVSLCTLCHYSCLSCFGSSSASCATCPANSSSHRIDTLLVSEHTCPCDIGFYDNGSIDCEPCFGTCLTCQGPLASDCLSCPNSDTSFRYSSITGLNTCPCQPGYF